MPITINGSGTVTGISVGGLPDGIVDTDMIAANAVTSNRLALEGVTKDKQGPGSIVQCLQVTKTDTWSSSSSNTWHSITGLAGLITPTTNTNKILVIVSLGKFHSTGGSHAIKYDRTIAGTGTTSSVGIGDAASSRPQVSFGTYGDDIYNSNHAAAYSHHFLDSPATTAEITYQVKSNSEGTYAYLNRSSDDTDQTDMYRGRASSSITLMEIVA